MVLQNQATFTSANNAKLLYNSAHYLQRR